MKILLKHNKHNIYFIFPTRVLCSKTILLIFNRINQKKHYSHIPYIPPHYARTLYREIKECKKRYGKAWTPIELESAQGDTIKIKF